MRRDEEPFDEEMLDDGQLEALRGVGGFGDADRGVSARLANCDLGDFFDDPDAGGHWGMQAALSVELLDIEDPVAVPLDLAAELRYAAASAVPVSRRRRSIQVVKRTQNFDEEDFEEGAERSAFQIINGYAIGLFEPRTMVDIERSLQFFFAPPNDGITFELCCRVLEVRPEIFRLRCQYEFFLRDVMFSRPMPFLVVPVPTVVSRELSYFPGAIGKCLASLAWNQPGIEHEQLLLRARAYLERSDERFAQEVNAALDYMESKYYMSHQHGWYTTGRNPMRLRQDGVAQMGRAWEQRGGTLSWSKLFGWD